MQFNLSIRSITREPIPEERMGSTSRRPSWLPQQKQTPQSTLKRQLTKGSTIMSSPSPSTTEDEASIAEDEDIEFLMKAGF